MTRWTLFQTRKITRDPTGGVLNGVNTVFRTTYYPIMSSGSLILHHSSGSIIVDSHTVDYDTGTVIFAVAPSVQPLATYTYSSLSDDERVDVLMKGFDEMQSRWDRPFYLSSSSASYVAAAGSEAHIYVVSKTSAGAVSDPVCGGTTFSAERVQVAFYLLCTEYAYLSALADRMAPTAISFREERGASVSQVSVPRNLEAALKRVEDRLQTALEIAQGQYGETWGAYIAPVMTPVYEADYLWQEDARNEERRTS
ncbi:MAG: hypothetical protein KJ556_20065 [Gammaproteobacteria bacterium]|nr:hypothetical protein [Gammaproteobacteria bacterium]